MTDNIHLKKKVTLKKKQPDSQQPPTPPPTPEPPTGPSGSGKGKWIAAALAGLLVIGGGGYYLSQLDSNDNQATISTAVGSTESENGASAPAEVTQNYQDQTDATVGNDETSKDDATASDGTKPVNAPNDDSSSPSQQEQDELAPAQNDKAPTDAYDKEKPLLSDGKVKPDAVSTPTPSGEIEDLALDVVRGKYGNNPDRRRLLGNRYAEIQKKVNEMYKKKRFH
jgi:hypothetical protein